MTTEEARARIEAIRQVYEIPHYLTNLDLAIPQMRPYNVPLEVVQELMDLELIRDDLL